MIEDKITELLGEEQLDEAKMDSLYLIKRQDGYYFIAALNKDEKGNVANYKLQDGTKKPIQDTDEFVRLGSVKMSRRK